MASRAFIGIPSYRHVTPHAFGPLLLASVDAARRGLVAGCSTVVDTYLPAARNSIAGAAYSAWQRGLASHVMWFDDDMVPPTDAIAQLMARDLSVVGGAYYRRDDARPIAFDLSPFAWVKRVPASGLVKVGGLGFGCLLMKIELLDQLSKRFPGEPWFQTPFVDGKMEGEDVFFFRRLSEIGIETFMDCDIQCGHVCSETVTRESFEGFYGTDEQPLREVA